MKQKLKLSSAAEHFSDVNVLNTRLVKDLRLQQSGDKHLNVLVKGSRFMRMERVVQALVEEAKACS